MIITKPSVAGDAGPHFGWSFEGDVMPAVAAAYERYGPDSMPRTFRFHRSLLRLFDMEPDPPGWHSPTHRELVTDYGRFDLWPDPEMPIHTIFFYGKRAAEVLRAREVER